MIIPYRTFPGDKRLVYRPIIEVKLKLNHKTIPIWAVIDSGADKTMINKKLGERLGYDFVTNKPTSTARGISGQPENVWDSKIDLEVDGFTGTFASDVAYMKTDNFGVLLGHIGFFEFFDIKFQTAQNQFEIELAKKS